MGIKVSTVETYKGVNIEVWRVPSAGFLYHALIKGTHLFFDRYRDAKIQITRGGKG